MLFNMRKYLKGKLQSVELGRSTINIFGLCYWTVL